MVYDLIVCKNEICYERNGVSCAVGDYIIANSVDGYVLAQVIGYATTTEEHIEHFDNRGEVVANCTETILYYEENHED